jgi:large subunit ribosomal protein L22
MATMEVSAVQRFVRRTPRKARLVADSVKGMRVAEALAQLEFSPKHAARDVAKAIRSAAANAEHNFNLNRDDLVLKQVLIDEGPTFRRRRPVSRSMAHEFFHRTCHITAVVEDQPAIVRAPSAGGPRAKAASTPAAESAASTAKPTRAKRSTKEAKK